MVSVDVSPQGLESVFVNAVLDSLPERGLVLAGSGELIQLEQLLVDVVPLQLACSVLQQKVSAQLVVILSCKGVRVEVPSPGAAALDEAFVELQAQRALPERQLVEAVALCSRLCVGADVPEHLVVLQNLVAKRALVGGVVDEPHHLSVEGLEAFPLPEEQRVVVGSSLCI